MRISAIRSFYYNASKKPQFFDTQKQLSVCLLFFILLCTVVGCTEGTPLALPTDDLSSTAQSGIATGIGNDSANQDYTLIVNGEVIASGNYIKPDQDYAELPFTTIIRAFEAEIEWVSETSAKVTFYGKDFDFDTENCMLIEVGEEDSILLPPPGGMRHYRGIGEEFVLDEGTINSAFQLLYQRIWIDVDDDDRTISIYHPAT